MIFLDVCLVIFKDGYLSITKGPNMSTELKVKAQSIYSQFRKAPILEMVQYMVNENVDAQLLHQLKLIDMKMHKNPHVKSYGEKIYDAYERVCKILVTYPSLEFKNLQFNIKKNKRSKFIEEFYGDKQKGNKHIDQIIDLANISIGSVIESNERAQKIMTEIINDDKECDVLVMFLKELSGEDYSDYVNSIIKSKSD